MTWMDRLSALMARKSSRGGAAVAAVGLAPARWTPRRYDRLADEGYRKNVVAYRCVREVARASASVPWLLYKGARELDTHPLLDLLRRPNPRQSGPELIEAVIGHLLLSGNAYLEVVRPDGEAPRFPEGAVVKSLNTPCRATVPAPAGRTPAETKMHWLEQPPRGPLTEAERTSLRALAGWTWDKMSSAPSTRDAIVGNLRHIAGARGYYRMYASWPYRVEDMFFGGLHLTDPSWIENGRYFVFAGCGPSRCTSGALVIADLDTGQVAAGIVHELGASGLDYYEFGHLTLFVRDCADIAFKGYARAYLAAWGSRRLAERHGTTFPGVPEPDVVEAKCG